MLPPGEGLKSIMPVVGKRKDRLVMNTKFAVLYSTPKVGFELKGLSNRLAHCVVERFVSRLARSLSLVHRRVRISDHVLRRAVMFRDIQNTDTGGREYLMAL